MIFCSASAAAGVAGAGGSGVTAGASGLGAGGGAVTGPGVRSLEIGGRTAARFIAPSPSGRFGFGFFSSISETLSTARGVVAFGCGVSAGFAAAVGCGFAGAGVLAAGGGSTFFGAGVTAGLVTFAGVGAGAFALFAGASFFFGSA